MRGLGMAAFVLAAFVIASVAGFMWALFVAGG